MTFFYRDRESIVNSIIENMQTKLPNIDFTEGEPLRTFIEAIAQEMDLQYWQIEQVYNSSFLETATGENLTELVKLLGVERKAATKAIGEVIFYRETPAIISSFIGEGTIIETAPLADGTTIQFVTTEDKELEIGEMEVTVKIEAVIGGLNGNLIEGKIISIIDPPIGIEMVRNDTIIYGGEDEEDDETLRNRASKALETRGLGTIDSLKGNIEAIDGINTVFVTDMKRGIGTVDVLYLSDIVPTPQSVIDNIESEIARVKPAGIDVTYYLPTINNVDITATLIFDDILEEEKQQIIDDVEINIQNYVNNLDIGKTLYINQIRKIILNASSYILDLNITTPSNNVTSDNSTVIRAGTITVS